MNFPSPRRRSLADYGLAIVVLIGVAAIIVFIAVGGGPTTGLIECKGTTGIYREYDAWAGEYQRYTVPDDPACPLR